MHDIIDKLIEQWGRERPDLDPHPMRLVGRVLRLARLLEARCEAALKPYGLTLWQFDVLATMRRFGKPYRMSPTQLMRQVMLSSGAMTNRIDRLEEAGYVRRLPDPIDRRGVLLELTAKGRRLVEQAIAARLDEAKEVTQLLSDRDVDQAGRSLRTILLALEQDGS